MPHQWFNDKKTNSRTYVVIGIVDYKDRVERKFYVQKMEGIAKKHGFLVKTRDVPKSNRVEILAKEVPLYKYKGVAWIHPPGGGDDYQVGVTTHAENLTIAKKQVRDYLIKKMHTAPMMADDFSIKKVKKQ